MFDAQGEDVVAGTHATEPIAVLDERLPAVAAELRDHATRLEHHYADLCDIEFTIEDGRLWMLQVRVGKRSPQAALRIAVDMAEDETFPLTRAEAVERVAPLLAASADGHGRATGAAASPLVTGLPASPGMASGAIATSPEAAAGGRRGRAVDRDPRPSRDLAGRRPRDGRGGRDPDLARRPGQPRRGRRARLGDPGGGRRGGAGGPRRRGRRSASRILRAGDVITIDGDTGEVFEGAIAGSTEIVPEARTLLAWAEELGIGIGDGRRGARRPNHRSPARRRVARSRRTTACAPSRSRASRTPGALADAVLSTPEDVQPILDRLVVDGPRGARPPAPTG